MAMALKL